MLSPSAREADPQKRSQVPCGPPKARTRMSRAVAALRVTEARSPETVSLSTNIRRPSTGSSTSKSISSHQGSWSSARATWGTVTKAMARTARVAKARKPLRGFLRLVSSVAARWSRACWFPASFPLRLPNQRILPLRRSLFLRVFLFLRSLPRPRPARFAIRLSGPGPLLTGCAGAGASALTSWDTCPA